MTPEHIHPRRKDRTRGADWIRAFLHRAGAGVFVSVRDGRPFPIPLNFVYHEAREAVYLHTGKRGRSRSNLEEGAGVDGKSVLEQAGESAGAGEDSVLEQAGESAGAPGDSALDEAAGSAATEGPETGPAAGTPVALCLYEVGRFLPAKEALEFGVEYASVVVFGRGVVVEDLQEAEEALTLLMEKYAPHLKAGKDYRPVVPEEIRRTTVMRLDIQGWSGKEKAEAPDFPGAYRLEEVRPSP